VLLSRLSLQMMSREVRPVGGKHYFLLIWPMNLAYRKVRGGDGVSSDPQTRASAQHGGTVTTLMALALQEGIIDTAILADEGRSLLPGGKAVRDPAEVRKRGKSRLVVSPNLHEFNIDKNLADELIKGRSIGIFPISCIFRATTGNLIRKGG
jgi:coenzyme F420-reducing hydrogenase beta subunit